VVFLSQKWKILCIGNSHTAGFPHFDPSYGGNPESSYEYWLNQLLIEELPNLNFILYNEGICGQTTREINPRLKIALKHLKYNLVIYWGGANDIALGYSPSKIWENIWNAFEAIKENSTPCMLVTIPPMNWPGIDIQVLSINRKIKKAPIQPDTYIIADIYEVLEKQSNLNPLYDAGDGVHLSVEGYKCVGETIFRSLAKYITDTQKT